MPPTFFRAVPVTDASIHGEAQHARKTVRLPLNVPYIVDNLWEHLRPGSAPCRRQAVYASPVAALAARYVTAEAKGRGTAVYELLISGPAKIAQLQVEDAKLHGDIAAVRKLLQALSVVVLEASWEARQSMAPLFMPVADKADMLRTIATSPLAASFIEQANQLSRFWSDVSTDNFNPVGEIFFQLAPGSTYRLLPIETA